MIFEDNLNILENKYPNIYHILNDKYIKFESDTVYIEDAHHGGKIVVYDERGNKIYLNSKYDPMNEADKYMQEYFVMPDTSVLVMYGLSNGYYVREYIRNSNANTRCIIYEPNIDIFMTVLRNIDISDLLKSDRIYFVIKDINTEEFAFIMQEWLEVHNVNINKLVAAPKYKELFREDYTNFENEVDEMYQRFYSSTETEIEFGKKSVKNNLYNLLYFEGCRNGMELQGKFPKDMPAIVVSAGPSLEKNVELLKAAKGKAFIFAVDSAISKVLEIGVKPDAIISVDCNKSVEHFKVPGIEQLPFFIQMDANTAVLDYVHPQNLFFCSADSELCIDLFKKAGSEIDYMEGGGSVATVAIASLISWGVKRIILIGQDLSFTGNRMHVGEDAIEIDENDDFYTYVKDIDGNDVIIRQDYYMYLKWIEETALKYKDIDFIDATEGGSYKKNLRQMPFRDAIEKYCTKEYDISNILLSVPRVFQGADMHLVTEAFEKMKNDFRYIKKQLALCKADCSRGIRILESGQNDIKELKRINKSIEKTDALISDCDERMYLYKYNVLSEMDMMQDMYSEEESGIKEAIRMYKKSEKYYASIVQIIPDFLDIIDDCILRTKGEKLC
ncbi:MAG: DUF115 domain-containing protein [Lachnospiraceae bacterium]|nr:DUF115 domain-containing protein [Lachnospiraceae bacterium]